MIFEILWQTWRIGQNCWDSPDFWISMYSCNARGGSIEVGSWKYSCPERCAWLTSLQFQGCCPVSHNRNPFENYRSQCHPISINFAAKISWKSLNKTTKRCGKKGKTCEGFKGCLASWWPEASPCTANASAHQGNGCGIQPSLRRCWKRSFLAGFNKKPNR